jgi:hypothetical protein
LHLDNWVTKNTLPPPNQLMPLVKASGTQPTLRAPSFLSDVVVPLGTYGGQNSPQTNFTCTLAGSYIPFANTEAERLAQHDSRLSIAERYRDQDDYLNRVRSAALDLIKAGFLLPEDAAVIIEDAASNKVFRKS